MVIAGDFLPGNFMLLMGTAFKFDAVLSNLSTTINTMMVSFISIRTA